MEEKERYIFGQRILYDNEKEVVCFDGFNLDEFMGIITNLLNRQDKENQQLKQQLKDNLKEIKNLKIDLEDKNKIIWNENEQAVLCGDCYCINNDVRRIIEENKKLKQQIEESEKSNEYFADRIEKADKEIKEIYKKYNELVEEYNNIKEEVDNNFVDGQKYNQLKQQLHDLPKKIVEEIREKATYKRNKDWFGQYSGNNAYFIIGDNNLYTILKKYGGEDE